ncbi:MAG: glycerol-3-phosphate dehydrogenase/oxidase [Proteobacteria bacterium]|nr:glycerol-3-phosphate dehydrogenase/oxidase [Pseudomonadota bacterium]
MRRDLHSLANKTFDLLIIGGGVTGACIARDASLRGLSVVLIEKNDFAHATSAHNSKLIHGGLRYLRNFELGLVRESLKERRIWQRIAPHLVHPLPFLVPLYGGGFKARATLEAGLSLYDVLSYDRGWLDDPAQRLPGHSWLNKGAALSREPRLAGPGLEGSFLYYDAQMYAPERLALECVADAVSHGAVAANHLEAETLLLRDGRVEGATLRDAFSDASFDVRAKLTIVAAGPWADIFLSRALGHASSHKLLRSKGIHLIVPAMTRDAALTVAAGGGHFFVLPWRGHCILGTTDATFPGNPDDVGVTESDIEKFLAFINKYLPSAELKRSDVNHYYAGLRPLVDDGSKDTYGASRRAEMIDHSKDDKIDGLFSVIGGKWTTSRDLAEKTVNAIVAKLGTGARPCTTRTTLMFGGMARFSDFAARQKREHESLPGLGHLAQMYGTRLEAVLDLAGNRPELTQSLSASGDIGAQVLYAMREEMALTLDDVVMRRTGIGQLGNPGPAAIETTAALMAKELSWSDARRQSEIASIAKNFETVKEAA